MLRESHFPFTEEAREQERPAWVFRRDCRGGKKEKPAHLLILKRTWILSNLMSLNLPSFNLICHLERGIAWFVFVNQKPLYRALTDVYTGKLTCDSQ